MAILRAWLAILGAAAACQAAFRYFDPADTAHVPDLISETGLFEDIAAKRLTAEAVPFEVNSPLWSDGAVKRRWIILRPGRSVPYDDTTDFFDYPDSTVFVKTFLLEKVEGDSSTRVWWETRLLMKKRNPKPEGEDILPDWYGFSFRWNAAQSEATLISREPYTSFDTVFTHTGAGGRSIYKKWNFPSREKCWYCHFKGRVPTGNGGLRQGRSVLGFFPAQIKGPRYPGGPDQVLGLFDRGVFSGTRPGPAELARRLRSIREPIPAGLSPEARRSLIDTLARSYLAGNCSGCHGTRNAFILNCPSPPNFDFHNLRPVGELAMQPTVQWFGLNDTITFDSLSEPKGRFKYIQTLSQYGKDTRSGIWDLALPPGDPDSLRPYLIDPGYASLSLILYRTWVRRTPRVDSGYAFRSLMRGVSPTRGSTLDSAEAAQRLRLFFAAPWGSPAWADSLARHGFSHDSVLNRYTDGYTLDGNQMPPLNSFIPDTTALEVLGEWVKYYLGSPLAAKGTRYPALEVPRLRQGVLWLPPGLSGPIALCDIRGRAHSLNSLGGGAYALPPRIPPGIYFLKAGGRRFRLSLL